MHSAQSRLGVVTSLGSARRSVGRAVESLPVPPSALKVGAAAVAGLAGAAVLRTVLSARRRRAAAERRDARFPISELLLTLTLPLLRHYLLGQGGAPGATRLGEVIDSFLKKER